MKDPFGGIILNVAFRMLVPFTLVYGIYVLCLGEFSPGGEVFNTLGNQPYMTRRMPSTHWGRVNSFIYTVSGAFSAWGNILIGKIVDNSGYDRAWLAVGAFGVATIVLAVTLNIMDKKQFYLLYEKKEGKAEG